MLFVGLIAGVALVFGIVMMVLAKNTDKKEEEKSASIQKTSKVSSLAREAKVSQTLKTVSVKSAPTKSIGKQSKVSNGSQNRRDDEISSNPLHPANPLNSIYTEVEDKPSRSSNYNDIPTRAYEEPSGSSYSSRSYDDDSHSSYSSGSSSYDSDSGSSSGSSSYDSGSSSSDSGSSSW